MRIKLVRQQPVPPKRSFNDVELVAHKAMVLSTVKDGYGDCLETDFDPSDFKHYLTIEHTRVKFVIRQISETRWRVWRLE